MDMWYQNHGSSQKKSFHIEFTRIDKLLLGFYMDQFSGFPLQDKGFTCIDWMYGLGKSLKKGYPTIDEFDDKSIRLPPYDEVFNAFVDRNAWNFRMSVGDHAERFSLWFKRMGADTYARAIYETEVAPSWLMDYVFTLFSGGIRPYDLVEPVFFAPPKQEKIKSFRLKAFA